MGRNYVDSSFQCVECKGYSLSVMDTRKFENYIVRKRVCIDCGATVRTIEVPLSEYNSLYETVYGVPFVLPDRRGRRPKNETFTVKTDEGVTEVTRVPTSKEMVEVPNRFHRHIEDDEPTVYSTDVGPEILTVEQAHAKYEEKIQTRKSFTSEAKEVVAEYDSVKPKRKPRATRKTKTDVDEEEITEVKRVAKEYRGDGLGNRFVTGAELDYSNGGVSNANKISLTKRGRSITDRVRKEDN